MSSLLCFFGTASYDPTPRDLPPCRFVTSGRFQYGKRNDSNPRTSRNLMLLFRPSFSFLLSSLYLPPPSPARATNSTIPGTELIKMAPSVSGHLILKKLKSITRYIDVIVDEFPLVHLADRDAHVYERQCFMKWQDAARKFVRTEVTQLGTIAENPQDGYLFVRMEHQRVVDDFKDIELQVGHGTQNTTPSKLVRFLRFRVCPSFSLYII